MSVKAVIFDLDGTILDSMPYWCGLAGKYLRGLGIEPDSDLDERLKTFTFKQSAEYFRDRFGVDVPSDKMVDDMNGLIGDHYKYDIPLKKGAKELFARLSEKGIKMCVATAAERVHAMTALSRLGVLDLFSAVLVCSELDCDKTEPTVYRAAAELFGTKKEETAVFEDSLYALMTAKNDGFYTVAVRDDAEPDQASMKSEADLYITSLSEFYP